MSYVRKVSPYSTTQGDEGTCWAHAMSRLISRLIKIHFSGLQDLNSKFNDPIWFYEGELLDEYYDTINCSTEHTIFHCIAEAQDVYKRKEQSFSMHKPLKKVINWESENLSALLFHFIFNSIKNKYCHLLYKPQRGLAGPIFNFFKLIRRSISEEKIKVLLKYNDYQDIQPPTPPSSPSSPEEELYRDYNDYASSKAYRDMVAGAKGGGLIKPTYQQVQENKVNFSTLITKLAHIFKLLRIALRKNTLKINLFMSMDLNSFVHLNPKSGFPYNHPTFNTESASHAIFLPSKQSNFFFGKPMWLKTIIQVLGRGLYVLLDIYQHTILITGIENEFLIVKNSWGSNRNWILPDDVNFIVDNKLSIATLIEHSKLVKFAVELVYIDFEIIQTRILTKKKHSNKSIIHNLQKTAKSWFPHFGMGKKATLKKLKHKYNKLIKNGKTIKNVIKKN
jgi:hypothetical protein